MKITTSNLTGIYARQAEKTGWVGLVGFLLYLLGGVMLGIATFRAGILPRWAGGGLAVGTVAPLVLSLLLPHELIRLAAVPVGLALAALGYALWSERREQASQPAPPRKRAQLHPTPAA